MTKNRVLPRSDFYNFSTVWSRILPQDILFTNLRNSASILSSRPLTKLRRLLWFLDHDFYSTAWLHSANTTIVRHQNLFIPSILSRKHFVGGRESILLTIWVHFRRCLTVAGSCRKLRYWSLLWRPRVLLYHLYSVFVPLETVWGPDWSPTYSQSCKNGLNLPRKILGSDSEGKER